MPEQTEFEDWVDRQRQTVWTVAKCEIGVLGIGVIYAVGANWGHRNALISAAAIAAGTAALGFAIGCFFGFLFGVPRLTTTQTDVSQAPTPAVTNPAAGAIRPNTNLERVSDWLTALIVGATLVNLLAIGARIDDLVGRLGEGLDGTESADAITLVVLVSSAIAGFFFAYLWARVQLWTEMVTGEALVQKETDRIRSTLQQATVPVPAEDNLANPSAEVGAEQKKEAEKAGAQVKAAEEKAGEPLFTADDYIRLGYTMLSAGDPKAALHWYLKAAEVDPTNTAALAAAGAITGRDLGDLERAEQLYFRALAADPKDATAMYNLACNRVRQKRFPEALAGLEQVISLDDTFKAIAKDDEVWTKLPDDQKATFDALVA